MSSVRPVSPGKTRTCPHCKAVILESASVCPGCQHHLRFGSDAANQVEARNALEVEGRIKHPPNEEPWEYTVVVYVRNERGEEVARHVINVGALSKAEERVVSLQVDVMPPRPIVPVQEAGDSRDSSWGGPACRRGTLTGHTGGAGSAPDATGSAVTAGQDDSGAPATG